MANPAMTDMLKGFSARRLGRVFGLNSAGLGGRLPKTRSGVGRVAKGGIRRVEVRLRDFYVWGSHLRSPRGGVPEPKPP